MSEKAKTNKKWVSSTDYRNQYDKIFKKSKPERDPEVQAEKQPNQVSFNK